MSFSCYKCNTAIFEDNAQQAVAFRDECPACKNDLHCCRNCGFYDTAAYNQCREPQAERITDKEKRNLCDYFKPGLRAGSQGINPKEDTLKKLDDLFK